jgi:hypothetical protein
MPSVQLAVVYVDSIGQKETSLMSRAGQPISKVHLLDLRGEYFGVFQFALLMMQQSQLQTEEMLDIHTLCSYSLTGINADATEFEMHLPIQFLTKPWL